MKIYMCHWCHNIYYERPFLCECKSNCFLKEYEATEEDLREIERSGAKIIRKGEMVSPMTTV